MTRARWTPATVAGAATSTGLIAQQVSGKAVRDALFLSSFPAAALPIAIAAAAAFSLVAILGLSRAMTRLSPAKLMPLLCAASSLGLVVEWAVGLELPRVSAALVYLHTTAFGPVLISIFWSLVNERFDPHTARRAIAGIAIGGTLGGVLGSLAAWRMASLIELPTMLLFLAGLHAACVVSALLIRAPIAPGTKSIPVAPAVAELPWLGKSPLLRHLGVLVALGATTTALLDYAFIAQAAATHGAGPPLLSFFAMFWLTVSVLSFVWQVTLGKIAMGNLALTASIAVLPAIVILGGSVAVVVPGLVTTAILRGTEAIHHNTFFRAAYEALYGPLSEARRRATKALIDVGFDRLGTVLGGGIAFAAVAVAGPSASSTLLAVAVALALATLLVTTRVHVAYLDALEQSMREGARGLSLPAIDTGSGQSALESKESIVRDALIERVEAIQPGGLGENTRTEAAAPGPAREALRHPQALIAQAIDLLSGDVPRTRRVLAAWPGSGRPLADVAILLLAHQELHRDASQALCRVAPAITGELVDALLDPAMDFVVRRRIPHILVAAASQRAVDGLLAGIRDERFEVRYACGRALMKLRHQNADIVIPREQIVAAILKESEKCIVAGDDAERPVDATDEDGSRSSLLDVLVRDRVDRSLEHVFTILALYLEREPLRMAFRALHHQDARHRGTALEYLNTILPEEIRDAVWPLLGETGPLPQARAAHEVLADLARVTLPAQR